MKKFNNDKEFDKFFRDELYNFEKEPPISVFNKLSNSIQTNQHVYNYKNWYWIGGISFALVIFLFSYYSFNLSNNSILSKTSKLEILHNDKNTQLDFPKNYSLTEPNSNNKKENVLKTVHQFNELDNHKTSYENIQSSVEQFLQKNNETESDLWINNTNKIKTDYQIYIKAATCKKNNGRVHLKANQDGIQFYWADFASMSESFDNLKSGKYTVIAKTENQIIDTLYINVPDSGNVITDFKIYDILIGNELITVFENNTLIDKKNWKDQKNTQFKWEFGDGSVSNQAEPQHSYANSGTYQVSLNVISKYGCSDSITKSYIISIPKNFVELSNIFSPNNDGINDYFQPIYYDLQSIECNIFNRHGELIYEWNKLDGKWDGKIRNTNQIASPGTYYYILKGVTKQGRNILHKGMVQLVL